MRVLLVDNYDSFTFNLVQRIGELDPAIEVDVVRNDRIDGPGAVARNPTHLIISPGPCTPKETGACGAVLDALVGRVPVLGVCLGHQLLADLAGMDVVRHDRLMHGKTSPVRHDGEGVFRGLSDPFVATRYHSLVVRPDSIAEGWKVSAWTEAGEVMGLRKLVAEGHPPVEGVQFHPESFMTVEGPRLIANFLGLPPDAVARVPAAPVDIIAAPPAAAGD